MTPETLVRNATAAFLLLVPVIVVYQILTGRIWLGGLLYERDVTGLMVYSPARLQLLLITIVGAVQYVLLFSQDPTKLPAVDGFTLTGLGGSQGLYLVSKAWAAYQAKKNGP